MSDAQILLACALWFAAGFVSGFLKQQKRIELLRMEIADLKTLDKIWKGLNT